MASLAVSAARVAGLGRAALDLLLPSRCLALQLPFATISGLLRRHGSEITRGGCRGRGCAGVVGLFAARGEAADAAAVQPRAGGGLGGAVPGRPARARAAQDRLDAGR